MAPRRSESREEYLERERARARRRYAADKQAYIDKGRKWREANPERAKEARKKWLLENADVAKGYSKKWHNKTLDRAAAQKRAWRRENPEKAKAAVQRWTKSNPEKVLAGCLARRNRLSAAGQPRHGQLSGDDIKTIVARQKGKCAVCGEKTKLTMDHIMPLALGGDGHRHNFQGLCRPCNSRKHAQHPVDFNRSRGLLL